MVGPAVDLARWTPTRCPRAPIGNRYAQRSRERQGRWPESSFDVHIVVNLGLVIRAWVIIEIIRPLALEIGGGIIMVKLIVQSFFRVRVVIGGHVEMVGFESSTVSYPDIFFALSP